MSYQIMKRHGGNVNLHKWRKLTWKGSCYVIPIIWPSRKGKTMEIVKRSTVARSGGGEKDKEVEHGRLLGLWNYSVCYYAGEHIALHICLNS